MASERRQRALTLKPLRTADEITITASQPCSADIRTLSTGNEQVRVCFKYADVEFKEILVT